VYEGNLGTCSSTNLLRRLVGGQLHSTADTTPLSPPHSQTDRSPDLLLSVGHADNAPDFLEAPVFPASPSEATHASPTNDVTARIQVFGVTAEPSS